MSRAPAALRVVAGTAAATLAAAGVPGDGARIALAVSGGPDSLALLHAARTLAPRRGWELLVLTVDHGLYPGSPADAEFVARHAAELGVPCRVLVLDPAELTGHAAAGPEAAARAARYGRLRVTAAGEGCAWVATGHTRDDQAETVLLQLLRGAGLDGLAAMRVAGDGVLRPLLEVTRAQTEACCAAVGVQPRADPTNGDERYLRNAVRRRVLPLLEELRPGATATLARTATAVQGDRALLDAVAAATLTGLLRHSAASRAGGDTRAAEPPEAGGTSDPRGIALPAGELADLASGLGRRVVRLAAIRAGQPQPTLDAADQVLRLARRAVAAQVGWAGGGHAERLGDRIVFHRRPSAAGHG